MARIEINDVAKFGAVHDVEAYQLDPEVWEIASNMRSTRAGMETIGGRTAVFGTPGVAPHFIMPVEDSAQTWWLYVSLTKAYVYDGASHTDITRAVGGDYTASKTADWNGTILGGIPIFNDNSDVPQFWNAYSTGTKLAALTNWPAADRCKVIRAFGPYLVALNITKSGTNYPHMVKWSHPADPGSLPVSWDETDPVYDAGENDLPDVNAGLILDGLPLRGSFYIYKENSTWRMTAIGGVFIFDFKTLSETSGILAPRCVTVTGDGTRHVVATQDDVVVHNGNVPESILTHRMKKFLQNDLDSVNYGNSFMFTDPFNEEVWFCYPQNGMTNPNHAILWNYRTGALTEADVNFRNAAQGNIISPSGDTWATSSGSWDTDPDPWSTLLRRKVVLAGTDATKFYEHDAGTDFDGTAFTSTLQRTGLSVIGRKRTGEWIVDYSKHKILTRLWIKGSGSAINVRVGFQQTPSGAVTWSAAKVFTPSTQNYLDFTGSGKAIAVEFSSSSPFRIMGYEPEISVVGTF